MPTQCVWHSTTRIGCGSATNGKCVVVVCQYLEWGNMMSNDAFVDNVKKAKSGYSGARTLDDEDKKKPKSKVSKKNTGRKALRLM